MIYRLSALINCIKTFGWFGGIGVFFQIYGNPAAILRVTALQHPVYLRRKTSDVPTFEQIYFERQYDVLQTKQWAQLEAHYRTIVAHGAQPLIIDGGANIGLSSIWLADVFPNARLIAVEPDTENVKLLRKNTEQYPNIEIVQGAIWASSMRLTIKNRAVRPWAYQVSESPQGDIQGYGLNELSKGQNILFVKLDIEGAEQAVFQSNLEWLERTSALTLEFHDWMLPGEGTSRICLERMMERDFDLLVRGENIFFMFR
jgi:FkbM family methyltransferase